MKCEFCRSKLNPYLLKQADYIKDQLIFEVECLNCRKYNYLSLEAYLSLKKDYLMPKVRPINNKLPYEMNIMVVSLERCGISWIGKTLSDIHEDMFGIAIEWNYEVSKVMATRNRFPIMEGWNSVYDVDPQILVDRGYDRVLIIQRDLEELLRAQKLYCYDEIMLSDKGLINTHHEKVLERRIKEYWDLLYGKNINHQKCLKVRLEDLNNYTVATFEKIFDFLNFPEVGRPKIIPVSPPNRNWEAYSSILPQGHQLCKRLDRIEKEYKE